MEERQGRLLLAIVLSLGVWMGVNYFIFPPAPPKKTPITNQVKDAKDAKTVDIAKDSKEVKTPEKKENPVDKKTQFNFSLLQSDDLKPVDEKDIKKFYIVTSSFLAQFSSLGGRIERFYVKNYPDLEGSEVMIIKSENELIDFNGEKYKAIEITRERGFDFNLAYSKEEISSPIYNHINFTPVYDEAKQELTFEGSIPGKPYKIKKVFSFFKSENYFKYNMTITNTSKEKVALTLPDFPIYLKSFGSLGPVKGPVIPEKDQVHYYRFFYLDGSFNDNLDGVSVEGFGSKVKSFFGFGSDQAVANKDANFDTVLKKSEPLDFFGTGSRYFIAVLNPLSGTKPSGVLLDNRKGNVNGVAAVYDNITLEPNAAVSFDYAAYVGIRELDGMSFRDKTIDPKETKTTPFAGLSEKLDKSFNQGITTPFRHGIVWILKKLHVVIPNYGWCIIIFGILFKAIFYPLNQKQADSMKKMQELSPQIKVINEKYEKDPALKQQKIMELYKKNGTNPMGGCLPMLVQIPIFIALYTAFSDTIDLWKSPFLWVTDLSEPDTIWTTPALFGVAGIALNVLPLIMVGTQVVQTRMTSVTTDPNQKTMMYLMPLIMLYFFWTMPSGVTLYWTIQNVLSIVQQTVTNRLGKKNQLKTK
jgi:YidC/Oxa1 family membrane protein insertase